mgnify:CR=1 FL=1
MAVEARDPTIPFAEGATAFWDIIRCSFIDVRAVEYLNAHDKAWNTYNDKFAWPALLDKHEDYKVYNFSTRGAGLSHFELVYNAERSMKEYDFKKRHITNAMYKPVEQ